jgi:hypothetical protein
VIDLLTRTKQFPMNLRGPISHEWSRLMVRLHWQSIVGGGTDLKRLFAPFAQPSLKPLPRIG